MSGSGSGRSNRLFDMTRREWAVMLPILTMIVMLGVYPRPFLKRIEPSVDTLVREYRQVVATAEATEVSTQDNVDNREAE